MDEACCGEHSEDPRQCENDFPMVDKNRDRHIDWEEMMEYGMGEMEKECRRPRRPRSWGHDNPCGNPRDMRNIMEGETRT